MIGDFKRDRSLPFPTTSMPTMTKLRADKRIRYTLKSTRRHLLSLIITLSITLNVNNRRYNAIFRLNLSIKRIVTLYRFPIFKQI